MLAIRTPEGIMSVDFFHNGEMALPMQQLMSYHKLPYFDIDPIHGLCDFVYSFFNYLFFDGTYLSQNAGMAVAGIFMAAFLAVVLSCCLDNKQTALLLICLFMPYLTEKAGVRYVMFLAAFLILLNDKVRKNDLWFLWWWVLLCMVAIAYNVSIGASMAVAFLPEVLWRLFMDIRYKKNPLRDMDRRQKRRLLVSWVFLCVMGVCFIPWFLQILRFLHENAGTTLWVNGTAVFGEEFNGIATFAVFIPYLCILALALSKNRKAGSAFLSMTCGLFVIFNYTCVRYDEALRLAVMAVLFCLIVIAYFYKDFLLTRNGIMALGVMLLLSGYLVRDYLPLRTEPLLDVEKVPAVKEVEPQLESVLLRHRYLDNLSNPEKHHPFRYAHLYHLSPVSHLSHLCRPYQANHLHHLFRVIHPCHQYHPCLSNSSATLQLSPQSRFLWQFHKQNDRLFRLPRFASLRVFSKAAYTGGIGVSPSATKPDGRM
mgnify:CR=1 FL=1